MRILDARLVLVLALFQVSSGGLAPPALAQESSWTVDLETIAALREEGLQRSQLPSTLSYMTDVLGARLTNSRDMERAQAWLVAEMGRLGLENVEREPFMDYGASWDNEYVSLHMLAPDYSPLVGYPLAHTPGTDGEQRLDAVLAVVRSRDDFERLRGTLRGRAVLSTLPAEIDLGRFRAGDPSRTEAQLRDLAEDVLVPPRRPEPYFPAFDAAPPRNPEVPTAEEILAFYVEEGVAVILESRSGWPGAVRGFARPGATADRWSRDATLAALPMVAVTPEHYNRMARIAARGIPLEIQVEVRNRHGGGASAAHNVVGEIPGSDRADEVVMIGAHFDTWHASPNASDNTSGTAVMLEAMRILKAVGVRPRRTIRIALWSGEEQGLWGSRAYVRRHFGNPEAGTTEAWAKLAAYFNQDYGPGAFRGVWLQGNEHVREPFATWMEPLRDMGMTTLSIQSVGSTDHIAFEEAGLPGFQFLQDPAPGTGGHTNLDFFDTLPVDALKKNAVIVAVFAYHAAMADRLLPRKTIR